MVEGKPGGLPLGQRLRAAREAKRQTEHAASRESGVPLRYLVMLEESRYPAIADPAYLTHFLRRYASCLGLDPEEAARDFLAEAEPEAAARRTGRKAPEMGAISVPPRGAEDAKPWLSPTRAFHASLVFAALTIIVGVYRVAGDRLASLGSGIRESASPAPTPAREMIAAARPSPSPVELASSPTPLEQEPVAPAASPSGASVDAEAGARDGSAQPVAEEAPVGAAPSDAPAPPYVLAVTATVRQVWVWISIDGGPRRAVSLHQGETVTFTAGRQYVMSVDDAGGVHLTLNGEPLSELGPAGRARRNLVIPSD